MSDIEYSVIMSDVIKSFDCILSIHTPTNKHYKRPEKRCASRLSSREPRPRAQSIIGPPMTYVTSCVLCAYHMPDLGETGEWP